MQLILRLFRLEDEDKKQKKNIRQKGNIYYPKAVRYQRVIVPMAVETHKNRGLSNNPLPKQLLSQTEP